MSSFLGFPEQALKFFNDIKANNNREWFNEHKEHYINFVQDPAVEFVVAFGTRLQAIAPEIQFDTATNGSGSVMRIYRDTRFSKDKTPYKDWLGIGFWAGTKKAHHSGVYFGISSDGGGMHVGSHAFSKEFLTAYRAAVAEMKSGSKLRNTLDGLGDRYLVQGEKLKKVPREYPPEHPRGELLKHKSLYVSAPQLTTSDLTSPTLVDICVKNFQTILPVHTWMYELGETLR